MARTSTAPRRQVGAGAACVTQAYAWLLWLCPRAFREEYGAEVMQVFRQLVSDAWARRGVRGALALFISASGDLFVGALKDYLALGMGLWNRSSVMLRMRSSAILVFCAYIAFVLIGMGFQKSTEEVVKSNLLTTYAGIGLAYHAVIVGAVIALLATLAGGLPIAFAALRQAWAARRWGIVALFTVPPISLADVLGWLWLLQNVIFPANHASPTRTLPNELFAWSLVALFIVAAIGSVAAVSVAITRSEVQPDLFRFALAPEVGVALGMLVTVIAIVVLNLQLQTYAPNYLAGPDGPIFLRATLGAHLVTDIILMALATLLVIFGIARSFSARHTQAA